MINYLGQTIKVKIDRQLGSKHPKFDLIYPINYGYIEGTMAGDGHEIDAYVLGEFQALSEYEGKVIGVIKRTNDVEDKLVLAKELNSYSKNQIIALTEFQERFYESEIITLDYLKQEIRNTVKAIIKSEGKILVLEEELGIENYYHLPGGGIEFLEESHDALVREISEELKCKVDKYSLYKTISNMFELEGMKMHEIIQVYNVELDVNPNTLDGKLMTGDLTLSRFRLIDPEEFKIGNKKFYPERLIADL